MQIVAVLATVGLAVASAAPAQALYAYSQGFEGQQDWYGGLIGHGSMEWSSSFCGQAHTGCGVAVLRHSSPTGYTSTFTVLHLDSFTAGGHYGYCSINYYAKRWNSAAPVTARLEVINTNANFVDGSYAGLTDRTLTNANWTFVGVGFYQFGARDVKVKITLPSPGNNNDVGFIADDLSVQCQVVIEGRG